MKNQSVRKLAVAGMIGAAYAVMAIFGSVFGLTFGPIQFRFSEALCLTPFQSLWAAGHYHRLPCHADRRVAYLPLP